MAMEFSESGPRLSEEQLDSLESEFSVALPQPYRDFLIDTNGGYPRFDYFDSVDGSVFVLQRLWSLNGDSTWDLAHRNRHFDRRKNFFEIGFSICGDAVAIRTRGRRRGEIVWFDHEVAPGIFSRRDIRPLAASFSELINGLRRD